MYIGGFKTQSENSDSTSNKLDYLVTQNIADSDSHVGSVLLNYYSSIRYSIRLTEEKLHSDFWFYRRNRIKPKHRIEKILYVGISLGGFFAYYFAKKYSCPAVIINPCYSPTQMLKKYVDEMINPPDFGYFRFTQENLDEYRYFEKRLPAMQHSNPEQIKVVVNNDDEIIPFATRQDIERLRKFVPEGELLQYPTGGHRATNFPAIVEEAIMPLYRKTNK